MNSLDNPLVRRDKISKFKKKYKKTFSIIFVTVCSVLMLSMFAFADEPTVKGVTDDDGIVTQAFVALEILVALIGAGLAVWGIINLLEGYGNDNPGAKSQGIKQLMAGVGIILLAILVVPALENFFNLNYNSVAEEEAAVRVAGDMFANQI